MPCYTGTKVRFNKPQSDTDISKNRAKTAYKKDSTPNLKTVQSARNVLGQNKQNDKLLRARTCAVNKASKKHKWVTAAYDPSKEETLPKKEIERIKANAKIETFEERMATLERRENHAQQQNDLSEEIRLRYKEMDDERRKQKEAISAVKDEFSSGAKTLTVLERSFLQKHEQEEEIKIANRLIINAKCHAVRDAQVQEKLDIEKKIKMEDERLVQNVLKRAVLSLEEEDKKVEKQKQDRLTYANDIRQQLIERERLRLIEGERVEKEAMLIREANEAIKRDEERQAQMMFDRKMQFRRELDKITEMSMVFKKMLCEQENEAEMKVLAFRKEQELRQRQLDQEKNLAKQDFNRKQEKLYMLGQKALDTKNQRDEMSYIREREKIEREYRRQEKANAIRKHQIEMELAEARARQLSDTKNRQALYIARAEQDFNDLIANLKLEEEKQNQMDDQRKKLVELYRRDIIRQINDKETERRRLLEIEKKQVAAWRESERKREENVRSIINAKLASMRAACLPEKYIKEVELQLQKISTKKRK